MTNITDISQYINLNSRKIGKKTAIVFQNKKISYAKLEKIISILSISLKRLGTVEELVNSVIFLSSNLSSFTTGANLVVDGGQSS